MSFSLNEDQKKIVLNILRGHGTLKAAAKAIEHSVSTVKDEMRRSALFRKRVAEAMKEGKLTVGDMALETIRQCAAGEKELSRTQVIASIALANAFVDGFKGTTHIDQTVKGAVKIITAVPRPKYLEPPKAKELAQPIIEGEVVRVKEMISK